MSTTELHQEIKNRLKWELVLKSTAATPVIFILSLFVVYYQFNVDRHPHIISLLMFLTAINAGIRYFIGAVGFRKKIEKKSIVQIMQLMVFSLNLNMILWSLTFWIVFSQISVATTSFAVAFMIATSLMTASVLTLCYVPSMAISYQLGILSSIFFAFAKEYYLTSNMEYLYMAMAIILMGFYYIRQTRLFYNQMSDKYKYEIELEISLDQLKVSNQKVIEERARSENASRLASLGEMAGGIAHEINNPLAIINGLLERVLWQISQKDFSKDEIIANVNRASSAVIRISRIIISLLRIAHKSDDTESFENIKAENLFEDVLNISKEKFKTSKVILELAPIPDVTVRTKPVLISQVLLNLLNNAYEHIIQLGEDRKSLKIYFKHDMTKLTVFVENSGPKISEVIQDKIFQPFFTTKEIGKGTGLGLSISKGILESLNEQIWLEKSLPKTTFCFTLPITNGIHTRPI